MKPRSVYSIGHDDRVVNLPQYKYLCVDLLSFLNQTRAHFGKARLEDIPVGWRRVAHHCPMTLALKDINIKMVGSVYTFTNNREVAKKLAAHWDSLWGEDVSYSLYTYRVVNHAKLIGFTTLFDGGAFSQYDEYNSADDDGTWR